MKNILTTAAIGSGLVGLIGLALLRRGAPERVEVPARSAPLAVRVEAGTGVVERRSPERPAAPGIPGAAARRDPPSEGFPDFEAKRALRHAEEDFWEDLGALLERRSTLEPAKYREKVSDLTAEYLGLDPSRAALFDRTAAGTTEEIGRAWKRRNESIEALSGSISLDERERQERQIQEDYETAKVQAVAPLESLLGDSPRHESFRRRLGDWVDAVR